MGRSQTRNDLSRSTWWLPALAAAGASLLAAGSASALPGPAGALFASSSAAGCVVATAHPDCTGAAPVGGAADIAVAPDGGHAYVAAQGSSAVVGIGVDGSGAPTRAVAGSACISSALVTSCGQGLGLTGVSAVAVSADGANVYTAAEASSAVGAFTRDPRTGALVQSAEPCVADTVVGLTGPAPSVAGCAAGEGLDGATDIELSPDGAHVYVAAARADAVAVLVRGPTGALTQLAGPAGCVSTPLATNPALLTDEQCGAAAQLDGASAVASSPDGRHVYVAAAGSQTLTTLTRDTATGALTPVGCVSNDIGGGGAPLPAAPGCVAVAGLSDPTAIALSPDGAHLYATSGLGGTIAAFRRDASTGLLEPLTRACHADPLAIAPAAGCAGADGIADARGIVVSLDGAFVYVVSGRTGSVATFARHPSTGTLEQLRAPHACLTSGTGVTPCAPAARLAGAAAVALTPGGRHVVVAAATAGAVVSLERQLAPVCVSTTVVGVSGPTPVPLPCTDPNGDALTYRVLNVPTSGTVTAIDHASGAATYAPVAGAKGTDTFSFAASDDGGATGGPAVASIEVTTLLTQALSPTVVDRRAPKLRSGKLVFDSRRRVRIKLRCPTHETLGCRGTLTIKTARKIPVRILRQTRLAAGPRAKPRRVVLVRRLRFSLKGAATRTISTRLKRKHVRLLERTGKTRVDVALVARDVAGNVSKTKRRVVLRPPSSR